MPSNRPSSFGGGGILRNQDGTIVSFQFTDVNPLFKADFTPKPGSKANTEFKKFYGVIGIRIDGSETITQQPIFAGDADKFLEFVTEDGMGVDCPENFSRSSSWFIFLQSLIAAGFPEENLGIVDPDRPDFADFSGLVGVRARFGWQVNDKATKKYGQKTSKGKDGKEKKYDREDLIVTNYYETVDVTEADAAPAAAKPAAGAKKPAAGAKKAPAAPKVDIAAETAATVLLILANPKLAKDGTLPKSKVSIKLLQNFQTHPQRDDMRAYLQANAGSLEGVAYDTETEVMSIAE